MKRLTILATLLFAAVSVSAQDYHIKLWDNTTAPTSNGVTGDEYERKPGTLTNTSSAEIWIYKPAPEKATGQAIVFCPAAATRSSRSPTATIPASGSPRTASWA